MGARGESRYVSVDEWRSLNRDAQTVRYEYIDGRIYMMAGGTANHSRISINVVRAIEDALGDSSCNVYNSDLSVRLSETRYTLPDASVTCSEQDQGEIDMVLSPKVIVEVLSESTEAYDRGKNLPSTVNARPSKSMFLSLPIIRLLRYFTEQQRVGWSTVRVFMVQAIW